MTSRLISAALAIFFSTSKLVGLGSAAQDALGCQTGATSKRSLSESDSGSQSKTTAAHLCQIRCFGDKRAYLSQIGCFGVGGQRSQNRVLFARRKVSFCGKWMLCGCQKGGPSRKRSLSESDKLFLGRQRSQLGCSCGCHRSIPESVFGPAKRSVSESGRVLWVSPIWFVVFVESRATSSNTAQRAIWGQGLRR